MSPPAPLRPAGVRRSGRATSINTGAMQPPGEPGPGLGQAQSDPIMCRHHIQQQNTLSPYHSHFYPLQVRGWVSGGRVCCTGGVKTTCLQHDHKWSSSALRPTRYQKFLRFTDVRHQRGFLWPGVVAVVFTVRGQWSGTRDRCN